MPRPGSPGRPGTPLIPPTWEDHHQPVAALQCTAQCVITRPAVGKGPFDAVTRRTGVLPLTTVYTGPCRLQVRIAQSADQTFGEAPVMIRTYMVALPDRDVDVHVEDRLTVTTASDATLVGRSLRVTEVIKGSLLWQRDLICDETQAREAS